MSDATSKLQIKGYPEFENGDVSGSPIATFSLQINPEQLSVSFDLDKAKEGVNAASGQAVGAKNFSYIRQRLSFEFMVDNSGVFPNKPQGINSAAGTSIKTAIDTLKSVTIKPTKDSHRPPYVHIIWGSTIDLKCTVTNFAIAYQRFNSAGDPIRAKVSLSVEEVVDEQVISREFQSPDISRMPTIREGDSLVAMCDDFYDDPRYFIRVAEVNDLPTFRRLRSGSVIKFPPLEK
jgi:hypothetical protein